jgi:uncharacterized protein YdaU (DUF1376 family)
MKRPWMPFYPIDFQMDTLDLKADELGVYVIMICLAWRSGNGSVSANMNELKTVLQHLIEDFHGHTFNRIVPKLLRRYFEFRDGAWYQKRVVSELQKADKLSAKQSQNASKRWSASRKINDIGNASAMPSQSQSHIYSSFGTPSEQTTSAATTWVSDKPLTREESGRKPIAPSGGSLATAPCEGALREPPIAKPSQLAVSEELVAHEARKQQRG